MSTSIAPFSQIIKHASLYAALLSRALIGLQVCGSYCTLFLAFRVVSEASTYLTKSRSERVACFGISWGAVKLPVVSSFHATHVDLVDSCVVNNGLWVVHANHTPCSRPHNAVQEYCIFSAIATGVFCYSVLD